MFAYYIKKSPLRTCLIQEGEFQFDALLNLTVPRVDYDIEAKKLVRISYSKH